MEILHILLVSMLPVVELRGAIPFAMTVYGFSALAAFSISVIGNAIPPLALIPLIGRVERFLETNIPFWHRHFSSILKKTRDNHEKKFELMKEFALVLLVAVPFPLTGVWTASLVAYIFGIPLRKAMPLIFLGLLIAGVVVTLITLGVSTLLF